MPSLAFEELVSAQLRLYLLSGDASLPATSTNLLRALIQRNTRPSSSTTLRLRLTDLSDFEVALSNLGRDWEYGTLDIVRDAANNMSLVDANVFSGSHARKRKRDEPEDENASVHLGEPARTGAGTDKGNGVRLAYALLQHGSAKRRLLAEQVCP